MLACRGRVARGIACPLCVRGWGSAQSHCSRLRPGLSRRPHTQVRPALCVCVCMVGGSSGGVSLGCLCFFQCVSWCVCERLFACESVRLPVCVVLPALTLCVCAAPAEGDSVWVTAVVVCVLKARFPSQSDVWALFVAKASEWVAANASAGVMALAHTAADTLGLL